jgi:hypothetical protein
MLMLTVQNDVTHHALLFYHLPELAVAHEPVR